MIRLRQHVPGFVDGFEPKVAEAETQEQLLAVPWVASYAQDVLAEERTGTVTGWPNGEERKVDVIFAAPEERLFHRFSLSDRDTLMVEHNGGDWFWVVGFIMEGVDQLDLPVWKETPTAAARREAWNRGEIGPQRAMYRCAEHGVGRADCCLKPGFIHG